MPSPAALMPASLLSSSCRHTCSSITWPSWRGVKKFTRIEDPYASRRQPTVASSLLPKNRCTRRQAYAWGLAATGALGVRTFVEPDTDKFAGSEPRVQQTFPCKVRFFRDFNVKDVAAGHGFSLFAVSSSKTSHTLYGTGVNTFNQLGWQEFGGKRLTVLIEPCPVHLPLSPGQKVERVAAGRCHSLVLVNPGSEVLSFGLNAHGQLGRKIVEREDYANASFVHRVHVPEEVVDMCCGLDHSLFLTKNGSVYACGLGADGQTGLGSFEAEGAPRKVLGDLDGERIVQVSTCADSNLAVSDKGDVFGWGNSEYLQFKSITDEEQLSVPRRLPIDPSIGRVIRVAAGGSACALLNERNQVYVWGYGFLGKGPRVDHLREPSLIPETLFHCDGSSPDRKVIDIRPGLRHFAAITSEGDLFTWGKNRSGCLGLGGSFASKALNDQFFPLKVQSSAPVVKVSLGVDHTIALCKSFT